MAIPLVGIVLFAAILRFWQLDAKSLWIDELCTVFYSLGKAPSQIPLEVLLPLDRYADLLTIQPQLSMLDAARAVTLNSNHPPLFFMLMQGWLQWFGTSRTSQRSLAAIAGVLVVWAVAQLGKQVAGKSVGLTAALLVAVSPYGVYLSQEARHYTLPMLLSVLALGPWLKQIQAIRQRTPLSWKVLAAGVLCNGLGFYIHYFYAFAVVVQWGILLFVLWQQRSPLRTWLGILAAIATTLILYLGLIPTLLVQQGSGGVEAAQWLSPEQPLWQAIVLPWVRTLAAVILMVILLPVEEVPVLVRIISIALMLGVCGWGLRQVWQGWRYQLSKASETTRILLWAMLAYAVGMLAVIMVVVYGLNKDLTLAPRYFFLLYPAVSVLLAVGWANVRGSKPADLDGSKPNFWGLPPQIWVWVVAGLVSIVLMGMNLTLLKPFLPEQVAARIGQSQLPIVVIMAAPEPVQRLMGLSYALALPPTTPLWWGFTKSFPQVVGDQQSQFQAPVSLEGVDSPPLQTSLSLWLLDVNRPTPFPQQVQLARHTCNRQGATVVTTGTHQQAYQCQLMP